MQTRQHTTDSTATRQPLLTLCRFLSARYSYLFMLALLSVTGILLSFTGRTQFAPYGITLLCLLIPSFLNDSSKEQTKQENNDSPLSVLYKRYHYSPIAFKNYRIALYLCMLLLPLWHKFQSPALTLFGISVPLLYTALSLAVYPILSHVLFFILHRRLMNGII